MNRKMNMNLGINISNDNPTINVVVSGDTGTGKSGLIHLYLQSYFTPDLDPTIEDTFIATHKFDDKLFNLKIVDTVDNDFIINSKRKQLFQECDVIILTYSINDITSFNNLVLRFSNLPIDEVVKKNNKNNKFSFRDGKFKKFPPILLVGTKADLENHRQVSKLCALKLVDELSLDGFVECSSLADFNIENVFNEAVRLAIQYKNSDLDFNTLTANDTEKDRGVSMARGKDNTLTHSDKLVKLISNVARTKTEQSQKTQKTQKTHNNDQNTASRTKEISRNTNPTVIENESNCCTIM